MISKLRLCSFAIVSIMLLASCSSGAPSAPVPTDPIPTATKSTPAPTIAYLYTGGIAGFLKEMIITPDGTATLTNRGRIVGTAKLSSDRAAALIKQFVDADFYNLKEHYEDRDHPVSDETFTTLRSTHGDRTKEVTVAMVSGAALAPRPLINLISDLAKIAFEIEQTTTQSPQP